MIRFYYCHVSYGDNRNAYPCIEIEVKKPPITSNSVDIHEQFYFLLNIIYPYFLYITINTYQWFYRIHSSNARIWFEWTCGQSVWKWKGDQPLLNAWLKLVFFVNYKGTTLSISSTFYDNPSPILELHGNYHDGLVDRRNNLLS